MKKVINYFKYCWSHFKGYRKYVVLQYLLNIISLSLGVVTPLLSSRLITMITIKDKISALWLVGIIVAIQIFILTIRHFQSKLDKFISRNICLKVKIEILEDLLRIEPKRMLQYNDGKIYSLIERDSEYISSYVFTILDSILNFITVIVIGVVILFLCYPLAIVIFITYPIMLISNKFFGKKLKTQQIALLSKIDEYNAFLKNVINNFDDIKGLSGNKKVESKFLDENEKIKNRYYKMDLLQQWNQNCSSVIGLFNFICVNVIGILLVVAEKLVLGDFIAFNSYSTSFTSSLNSIVALNAGLQPTFVVLDRLQEIEKLNVQFMAEENNKECTLPFNETIVDTLSLDINGRRIFNDLSFVLNKGKILKISGKNGCGKTSLFRILKKELDYCGNIYFNKENFSDIAYSLVQENILFLRQNPSLIHLSLYDNLTLFDINNEINESEIIEACKKTLLWEDVLALPEGLYTSVDDNIKLSAGQIQKIQLTRAILSKAKIILCDEIFANLDIASKEVAINILNELHNEGRTILFVSHQTDIFIDNVQEFNFYEEKNYD